MGWPAPAQRRGFAPGAVSEAAAAVLTYAGVDLAERYGYTGSMKATIDVPDALYRQVKARAALEGRAIREVTIELYEGWLRDPGSPAPADRAPLSGEEWLARWEQLGAETARKATDPRATREILLDERR
jgi:hypothetical protein